VEGFFAPGQSGATAAALADGLASEHVDLVLTGLQSTDTGSAEVGVVLAERLGMPHATIAAAIVVTPPSVAVTRELEGGWFQNVTLPLPALVTVQSGINQLRYATLKGIMAAKKKEMRVHQARPSASGVRITRVYTPSRPAGTRMIPGTATDAARELVRILREDERIL
jgi:electron transfer flavoprotein beta subunit